MLLGGHTQAAALARGHAWCFGNACCAHGQATALLGVVCGFMLRAASAWSVSLFGMQVSMVWQLVRFPDGIAVSWWSIFYCFCPGVLESIFASTAASGCSNTPAGCACVAHSGCCQRGAQPASTLVAPGTMAGCSWRNALSCKLLAA
jgi:hypothetical protein